MIAGETQKLLADRYGDDAYDDFLFFGNKEKRTKRKADRKVRRAKRRSDPKRIARKARNKNFFSQLGQAYRELGGGAAIGGAIDTIARKPIPRSDIYSELPSDFSVGLSSADTSELDSKNTTNTILYIAIGVIAIGGIGVLVYQSQKNKYVPIKKA